MVRSARVSRGLLAATFAVALAGCGTAGPDLGSSAYGSAGSGFSSGAAYGASDAQVGVDTNIMELNSAGSLNSLSDADLMALDNTTDDNAPPVSAADPTVQDLAQAPADVSQAAATGATMTKVGIVRSNANGQFFLQINKGFLWWRTQVSLPLVAPDTNTNLRIASDLNCKVIMRGAEDGNACMVRLMFKVPDFAVIWDLFTEGHIAGKAYDSATMAGLPNASVTIKSDANGRIWRAVTHTDGSYSVGQLDPGVYDVSASAAGFGISGDQQITVSKMHTSTVNLALATSLACGTIQDPCPSQPSPAPAALLPTD